MFGRSYGVWTQRAEVRGIYSEASLGHAVATTERKAVAGAPDKSHNLGAAWVYRLPG